MDDTSASLRDMLSVNAVPGLGAVLYRRLVERFGSWPAVLAAGRSDLAAVEGIGPTLAKAIRESGATDFSAEIDEARALGIDLVPYTDERYPAQLKEVHGAPLVLYVKGELRASDRLSIAVVGSRRCTH